MANKFTRAIDAFFEKWGQQGEEIVQLGYCKSGDEDGDTNDLDYIGDIDEISDVLDDSDDANYKGQIISPNWKAPKHDEFWKDWHTLWDTLYEGFRNDLEPCFEGTNCIWSRYYFVSRDYKILSIISRGDMMDDWEDNADVSELTEDDAEKNKDKQTFARIKCDVGGLIQELYTLTHGEYKDLAKAEILKALDVLK